MTTQEAEGIEAISTVYSTTIMRALEEMKSWSLSLYRRNQLLTEENDRLKKEINEKS